MLPRRARAHTLLAVFARAFPLALPLARSFSRSSSRSFSLARALPRRTLIASSAYSTWKRRPSGENVLIPRSYSLLVWNMVAASASTSEREREREGRREREGERERERGDEDRARHCGEQRGSAPSIRARLRSIFSREGPLSRSLYSSIALSIALLQSKTQKASESARCSGSVDSIELR